ncbi:MAG TPA: diadenylate cyclase CdaA [Kiritimatiellia bacterium]|mgnify:CR=1 FL=1|nr:diadenylate cyclase CdaA [Kiritimatiellia bacterium]
MRFDFFPFPGVEGVVEIAILSVMFYYILRFISGTRGAQVLTGLIALLVGLMVVTNIFRFDTLNWLLQRSPVYLAFVVLVVFQPEIRRVLEELGRRHRFASTPQDSTALDAVLKAMLRMSEQKIGALIAIERSTPLSGYNTAGVKLQSDISPELLINIFYPRTPLHDGGVIISGSKISYAACVFPVSQKSDLNKALGTRHRAAIGLTEETDAVALVVSEETGAMSVAYKGRLRRGLDEERLERLLTSIMMPSGRESKAGSNSRFLGWFSRNQGKGVEAKAAGAAEGARADT